jgi:hypothetical protein
MLNVVLDIIDVVEPLYHAAKKGEVSPQALEFLTPLFPHLVPPAIMVWIFVGKYIFEPFIHILQHIVLHLSHSVKTAAGPRNKS